MNNNTAKRPLKSWADVNEALAALSRLNAQKDALEGQFTPEIERLTAELSGKLAPVQEQIDAAEERIRNYVTAHAAEFAKQKTRELAAGSVSVRKTTRVELEDEEKTADALMDLGFENCVKITYKPVKAAIKNFEKSVLELIGAAVVDDIKITISPIKAKE